MKIRHLIEALPLLAIALVAAAIVPKFFPPSADPLESDSDRPRIVSVPEKRELPQSEEWQVVRVSDGDTISVRQGNRKERIRFCGIDAMEKAQSLGQESKANLERLISEARGKVQLSIIESDRYGRKVAEVFTVLDNGGERFLNEEQVKAGLAFAYHQYLSNCINRDSILAAEEIAKKGRVGVWSDPNPLPPWEFRRALRQNRGN